jgi:hypothetical protein
VVAESPRASRSKGLPFTLCTLEGCVHWGSLVQGYALWVVSFFSFLTLPAQYSIDMHHTMNPCLYPSPPVVCCRGKLYIEKPAVATAQFSILKCKNHISAGKER